MACISPSQEVMVQYLKLGHMIPCTYFAIHYLLIMLFNAILSELSTLPLNKPLLST